jgi:hypothetical protein
MCIKVQAELFGVLQNNNWPGISVVYIVAKCFFLQRSVYLELANAAFSQEDFSEITPNRRAENYC